MARPTMQTIRKVLDGFNAARPDRTATEALIITGPLGTRHTVEAMAALVHDALDHKDTPSYELARQAGPPRMNATQAIDGVFRLARDRMTFAADPHPIEDVRPPDAMAGDILTRGKTEGDCDERTVLICTLLGHLGVPCGFALVSTRPDGALHHVLAYARPGRKPIPMDAQVLNKWGSWPKGLTRTVLVPIA